MNKNSIAIGPVSNTEAFKMAEQWRRFAHRQSLVFKDGDGHSFRQNPCFYAGSEPFS